MNQLIRRNSFFDDFFTKDVFDFGKRFLESGFTMPSVNVKEEDSTYQIMVAAPGMKKEDFNIGIDRNILTISSENKSETEEKDEQGFFTKREFNFSSFSRSFTLPESVDIDNIEASYENGILNVSVPKKEIAMQNIKRIEVK